MTRAALLLPLLLVACGALPVEPAGALPDLTPIADQDQFAKVAWEALGQHGTPPLIEWHREGCDGNPEAFPKATERKCVNGTYYVGFPFVSAAVMGRPWQSAVAHEFQHFIDWRDRHVSDVDHLGPAFQEGGAVNVAEMAMAAAGW